MITIIQILAAWCFHMSGMWLFMWVCDQKSGWYCIVASVVGTVLIHIQQGMVEKRAVEGLKKND